MDYKCILKRTNFLDYYAKSLKEYWFVMIKPQTANSIIYEIIKAINESQLEIIDIISHELTQSEADKGFGTKPSWYRDYLCSSSILCIVVCGEDAARKCLVIKEKIRLRYNVDYETYKNFIHVAEEGLEFKNQKDILFPKHKCVSCADLYINWRPGILEAISKKAGTVSWVGIVTEVATYNLFIDELLSFPKEELKDIGILIGIKFSYDDYNCVCFISPWLLEDIYELLEKRDVKKDCSIVLDGEGVNILEITKKCSLNEQVKLIDKYLSKNQYRGIMTMCPRFDMQIMEAISDICYENQLVTWGGSENVSGLGDYIMPMFRFTKFLNAYKNI